MSTLGSPHMLNYFSITCLLTPHRGRRCSPPRAGQPCNPPLPPSRRDGKGAGVRDPPSSPHRNPPSCPLLPRKRPIATQKRKKAEMDFPVISPQSPFLHTAQTPKNPAPTPHFRPYSPATPLLHHHAACTISKCEPPPPFHQEIPRIMPADNTVSDTTHTTQADAERARRIVRDNAKRVIRESGIGEMLQTLNRNALQERGWFEEYDSGVLFKVGLRLHPPPHLDRHHRRRPRSPAAPPTLRRLRARLRRRIPQLHPRNLAHSRRRPPRIAPQLRASRCRDLRRLTPEGEQRGPPHMPRPMTPEDLLAMRIPEEPQLSPDGTLLAYALMEINADEYAYRRTILDRADRWRRAASLHRWPQGRLPALVARRQDPRLRPRPARRGQARERRRARTAASTSHKSGCFPRMAASRPNSPPCVTAPVPPPGRPTARPSSSPPRPGSPTMPRLTMPRWRGRLSRASAPSPNSTTASRATASSTNCAGTSSPSPLRAASRAN